MSLLRITCFGFDKRGFFNAIREGEGKSFIDSFLEAGYDVNIFFSDDGRTVLSCACENGNLSLVEYLVQIGARLCGYSGKNFNGSIPLHIAAKYGHVHIVEFFHNLGVSLDSCDNNNSTPLHYAAEEGHIEVIKFLIQNNASMNVKTCEGSTPLLRAAKQQGILRGNLSAVKLLINAGADVECDLDGWTILHFASIYNWLEIVQSLVTKNCDVNVTKEGGLPVPLLLAAKLQNLNVVEMLINSGADVGCCDSNKWKLLHFAASNGWLDLVKSLIKTGYDLNAVTSLGETPLYVACRAEEIGVIKYLLMAGADWRVRNKDNLTAFSYSIKRKRNVEAIRLFVENGAYFEHSEYLEVRDSPHLKDLVLTNIKLCTQAIINNFNNKDLPLFYKLSGYFELLPPIENLKIAYSQDLTLEIEKSVKSAIQAEGYCSLIEPCCMVLQMLSVKTLIKYYQLKIEKSSIVDFHHQLSVKKRRLN